MMQNFYLVNVHAGWAAICISKNASTSLKTRVILDAGHEGPSLDDIDEIDGIIGSIDKSLFLSRIGRPLPSGMLRFAVWRDPVDRLTSVFYHFSEESESIRPFAGLQASVDGWLDWVELELSKPVTEQDEHVRRQSDYFSSTDVDAVVPLADLSFWFQERGWGELPRQNARNGKVELTSAQRARIRSLYWKDYIEIEPLAMGVREKRRAIAGLWIGNWLPPLAQLSITSFLHHGFRFILHTYGPVDGVPEGTELRDAGELVPHSDIFTHASGSLAPAADRVRYRYLSIHGGMWTDLDVVCLDPDRCPDSDSWFALQETSLAAVGLVAFPPTHPVPTSLELLARDPATVMPWDSAKSASLKNEWKIRNPEVLARRQEAGWEALGPVGFTEALKHFGLLSQAKPASQLYPICYTDWRKAFDGSIQIDDPLLNDAWAVHLWGEMLRRDQAAMGELHPASLVAELMHRHRLDLRSPESAGPADAILVYVCSCSENFDRRKAIRETWASQVPAGIDVVFFTGNQTSNTREPSDTFLGSPDSIVEHRSKMLTVLRHALMHCEFEWIFKCDDDTYVDLTRLPELVAGSAELVGNEFVGTACSLEGRGGYLVSRRLVERIVDKFDVSDSSSEDFDIERAATDLGALIRGDWRLRHDHKRYPRPGNTFMTAHCCSPDRMRAIYTILNFHPIAELEVTHEEWKDRICFYEGSVFVRSAANCCGMYEAVEEGLVLRWFDWAPELLPSQEGKSLSPVLERVTHKFTPNNPILIAICSCHANLAKRQAVRDTWFPRDIAGITARFFIGRTEGEEAPETADTISLDVPDDYEHLPAKVTAFFKYALENFEFEWLFKCDDDTYVDLERLPGLVRDGVDLVGNVSLLTQNFASGGAGYLVRRWLVEAIVEEGIVPEKGYEDRLISNEIFRLGGVALASADLGDELAVDIPRPTNTQITSHWMSPDSMRAAHVQMHEMPMLRVDARHALWSDDLILYNCGTCWRAASPYFGNWSFDSCGHLVIQWFNRAVERFVKSGENPIRFSLLGLQAADSSVQVCGDVVPKISSWRDSGSSNGKLNDPLRPGIPSGRGETNRRHPLCVVLGSDAAGIEPNATLVASLLRHTSEHLHVRIFSRELPERSLTSGRLTLEVIRTPSDLCFTGRTQSHVSSAGAFDRMAALRCCTDWDRAVIFDYDQLIIGDPSELFHMELGDALAAVRLWPGISLGHACREFVGEALPEKWSECEHYRFFHMGPVLNLAAMREARTLERFMAFHRDCHMEEQIALCAACEDRVVGFEENLNWFPSWRDVQPDVKILHYHGAAKPWNDRSLYAGVLWRSAQTSWNDLTFGLWDAGSDRSVFLRSLSDSLGEILRSVRRDISPMCVLEIGGWDFPQMRTVACQWLRSVGDRWSIVFRGHVDPLALEQAIERCGDCVGVFGDRTEILDGESTEVLGWMLGQDNRWESYDAAILHVDNSAAGFLAESALVWRLLRPGGVLVIEPVGPEFGEAVRNIFRSTVTSFLESIRDQSTSDLLLSRQLSIDHFIVVGKAPTMNGEEKSYKRLSNLSQLKPKDEAGAKTIVLEMQGRMGNQMFQYAHARALAKRLGANLRLTHEDGSGEFQLGSFGINYDSVIPSVEKSVDISDECRKGRHWFWEEQIRDCRERVVKLRGFFQNESCFEPIAEEIRRLYSAPPSNIVSAKGTPVCVHVRRGDFSESPKHEVCMAAYYNLAIRLMEQMVDHPRFFVISDDLSWCRAHLEPRPDLILADAQEPIEALATMMACKAFVISNSTFGWWGAWLANGQPVICPTQGLADRSWEMFPDRWIRLPGKGI